MARTLRWIGYAVVVLVGGYALLGYFVAPGIIESRLVERLEARTGRPVSIADTTVHPFRLRVVFERLRIGPADDEPLAEVARLEVDVDASSFLADTWTLDALRLVEPSLNLVVGPEGTLNVDAGRPDRNETGGEKRTAGSGREGDAPALVVEHLAIVRGRVALTDRSVRPAATATLAPIDLDVADLAFAPEGTGRYRLEAALPGGGKVTADGRIALAPLAVGGSFRLTGLRLAGAWAFARDRLDLAEPRGSLDLSGRWHAGPGGRDGGFELSEIDLHVRGLALARRGTADAFARMADLRVRGAHLSLAARTLEIPELVLAQGRLVAVRDERGRLNWRALVPDTTEDAQARPWHVTLGSVRTEAVALRYVDRSRTPPIALDIGRAGLAFSLEGKVGAGNGDIRIRGLQADLADLGLAAPPDAATLARLDRVRIEGGRLDTGAARLGADAVVIRGGSATLARNAAGEVPLVAALRGRSDQDDARDWTPRVERARASDLTLTLEDRSAEPPVRYVVSVDSAVLAPVSDGAEARYEARLDATLETGGEVSVDGSVAPDLSQATLRVGAGGIAIAPLSGWLAARSSLGSVTGVASLDGTFRIRAGDTPATDFDGRLAIESGELSEAGGGRFLSWSSLEAESVQLRTAQRRWAVDRVLLVHPHANLVLAGDRTPNFTGLLGGGSSDPGSGEASRSPYAWSIGRVDIERGELRFTDHGVPGPVPFAVLATRLRGALTGLDSSAGRHARLELEARIGEHAMASARARLDAADPLAYTDVLAQLSNQPMPPLSPYAVELGGRRIAAGRLWLDADYRIRDGALEGENRLVARRLRLGDEVSGAGAGDAPLGLAVAMIEGADRRVRLTVPVQGTVRDPDFDFGAVFEAALSGALEQVVSAPFEAVASLFDDGAQAEPGTPRLGRIAFQPGDADLSPRAGWMIERVAEIARSRQGLDIVVPAGHAPDADAAAMREDRARHALARRLGRDPAPREDAGPIAFGRARTQHALEEMLARRSGPDAVAALAHRRGITAGRDPDRVADDTPSPDRDFYVAVFRRVAALEPLPENATESLARRRGQRIARALERAGVDPARIRVGEPRIVPRDAGGDVVVRLALRRDAGRPYGSR